MRTLHRPRRADEGAVLPIVLVCSFILATVVVSLTGYVTADLRYSRTVEDRADRLAAADGGLRYGIENLRNFKTLCTTKAGTGGGFTTIFPPIINGAQATVTCRRVGQTISDVQGWGVVVTGEGVPSGQPYFSTKGGGGSGGNIKTFSGPIYIKDPTRIDLDARLQIENGDLWYSKSDCETEVVIPEIDSGWLEFTPDFFRGPSCTPKVWNVDLFNAPTQLVPTPAALATPEPVNDLDPNCRVFSPGRYSSVTLSSHNYFKAGDYYFDDLNFEVKNGAVTFGFPSGGGDSVKVDNLPCETAMTNDRAQVLSSSDPRGGATIWLGGSSAVNSGTNGGVEVFRRRQAETFLGLVAVPTSNGSYQASSHGWDGDILTTKAGAQSDVAIHGLFWAPRARMTLDNITNAANGQLLGGVVLANMDTQASASASAFAIGIEANPVDTTLLLTSTATKDGQSTTIRAVVQFRPDSGELAVNSWRVQN